MNAVSSKLAEVAQHLTDAKSFPRDEALQQLQQGHTKWQSAVDQFYGLSPVERSTDVHREIRQLSSEIAVVEDHLHTNLGCRCGHRNDWVPLPPTFE